MKYLILLITILLVGCECGGSSNPKTIMAERKAEWKKSGECLCEAHNGLASIHVTTDGESVDSVICKDGTKTHIFRSTINCISGSEPTTLSTNQFPNRGN